MAEPENMIIPMLRELLQELRESRDDIKNNWTTSALNCLVSKAK
jgi:hypothetical protein